MLFQKEKTYIKNKKKQKNFKNTIKSTIRIFIRCITVS